MTLDQILMKDRAETYEEWLKTEANSDAVKNACIMDDYDPTGEVTAELIKEWFFDYHIGWKDPDRFRRYHIRNLRTLMPQYREKLRNQPGIGLEIDNLVTVYRERQLKTKGSGDNSTTYGSGQTTTKSGNETNVRTGSQEHIKDGTESDTRSGGHTTKDVEGLRTQTTAPQVERVTTTGSKHSEWAGNAQVQANNPMSESYNTFISPDEADTGADTDKQYYEHAYQHMPALDWHNVSTQAQDGHRGYNKDDNTVTESYKYGNGVKGDVVTTEGDKENPSTSELTYQDEKSTHDYNGVKDTTTFQAVTDTHTYNAVMDDVSKTGTDTTHNSDERTDREQVKGRNEDPATLLARAVSFIGRSNAWLWMREQIAPVFDTNMED